jgi:hypothetical protein
MASNTRLRLTTQVGQAHATTEVLLDLGTNKQPSEPKHTNTHSRNLHDLLPVLHRSDRWPVPVRPVATAAAQQVFQKASVDFLGPETKTQPAQKENPTQSLAKQHQKDQELTKSTTTQKQTCHAIHPRQIPQMVHTGQTGQEHQSDRCNLGSSGRTTPAGQHPQIQTSISQLAPRTCARLWG